MRTIGVIGLGAMGLPMARTLAAAGFDVRGYDAQTARRALFERGVDAMHELLPADAILLSLPDDAAVRAVVAALLPELSAGTLLIDTSTVGPDTSRAIQADAAAANVAYVDAPVSGGAAGAAAGSLLVMAGGAPQDVERAGPVLDALARKVARCGGPGAGALVKLVNNMLCAGQLILAGEALRIARAGGVAPEAMLDAVNAGSGRSAVTEVNLPRWVLPSAFDSAFPVAMMTKDVSLAAALPGAGAPVAEIAARWRAAQDVLGEEADFNRIVEAEQP